MNRVLKICCLLYVCVLSFSTGVAQVVDTARWDLNRISSWMLTQIQYPVFTNSCYSMLCKQ